LREGTWRTLTTTPQAKTKSASCRGATKGPVVGMLRLGMRFVARRLAVRAVGVGAVAAAFSSARPIAHAEATPSGTGESSVLDQPVPPPAKLDDPEYNAAVLETWRGKVRSARVAWQRGDLATAEAELQEAYEMASHFGSSSAPLATSLLNLAQLYRRTSRQAEAEPLLRRAADILDQTAGPYTKVSCPPLAHLPLRSASFEKPPCLAWLTLSYSVR
jgi:tetratricopeptide (TPR) repeat protein